MHVADSGHHNSTDLPEVVDTVVGLMGPPPIDAHIGGPPNGLNHLGALPPLPPNLKKAYTDKGVIGKSLILFKSILHSAKKIS